MTLRAHGLIALVVLLVVAMPAILRASDSPLPLSSYNWAVKASPNLAAKPPPKADIRKLIEQEDSDWGEDNDGTELCSFKFVDLGHDGNLTLLVTRHDGGRGGCGDVHVVDRTAAGFEEHNVWGGLYGVDDVNNVLVDIDGQPYLSDDDNIATYDGADRCSAGYTRIYGWDGSNYSDQSAQPRFKPFYQHEVESMKARKDENPECIKASIAKIQRTFLGAPPNTGLDDAIRLAKSNDPSWREFAVGLLSNIGTAEAKDYLHALTTDPNKEIADYAKKRFAFTHFGQQQPPQKHFLPIDDGGTLQTEPDPPPAGPWRLILPPMKGDKPDLTVAENKWEQRFGFDSQEQCEFGAESLRKTNGSEPFLHGKCVAAASLAAH